MPLLDLRGLGLLDARGEVLYLGGGGPVGGELRHFQGLLVVRDHALREATTEKNKGKYGPAASMSDGIITAQTAEITEMNKLLGKN